MAVQNCWRRKRLVLICSVAFIVVVSFFSCSGKKTKDQYPVSQQPGGPSDPVLVKKLFDVKCAICHGFDGRQQFSGAKDLGLSTMNKADIVLRISEGKGAMPPQKEVLSEEQINALSDFVLSLRIN